MKFWYFWRTLIFSPKRDNFMGYKAYCPFPNSWFWKGKFFSTLVYLHSYTQIRDGGGTMCPPSVLIGLMANAIKNFHFVFFNTSLISFPFVTGWEKISQRKQIHFNNVIFARVTQSILKVEPAIWLLADNRRSKQHGWKTHSCLFAVLWLNSHVRQMRTRNLQCRWKWNWCQR